MRVMSYHIHCTLSRDGAHLLLLSVLIQASSDILYILERLSFFHNVLDDNTFPPIHRYKTNRPVLSVVPVFHFLSRINALKNMYSPHTTCLDVIGIQYAIKQQACPSFSFYY